MAYVNPNFKTKKALKEAVVKGEEVTIFQPGGMFPLGEPFNGWFNIEGPHYPEPHRWYGDVKTNDAGHVVKVR